MSRSLRVTSSTTGTLLVVLHFWTWREAIETATRADACDRPTVKRDGGRWAVTYLAKLTLMNAV